MNKGVFRVLEIQRELVSEEKTLASGAQIGARIRSKNFVALSGPLGSGKTTFVRGILRGAGFKGRVQSPTFTLIYEYRSLRPRIYHIDLYRVSPKELLQLGLEEYFNNPKAACLVEWPKAAQELMPADRVEIEFSYNAGGGRSLRLRALGPRSRALLEQSL